LLHACHLIKKCTFTYHFLDGSLLAAKKAGKFDGRKGERRPTAAKARVFLVQRAFFVVDSPRETQTWCASPKPEKTLPAVGHAGPLNLTRHPPPLPHHPHFLPPAPSPLAAYEPAQTWRHVERRKSKMLDTNTRINDHIIAWLPRGQTVAAQVPYTKRKQEWIVASVVSWNEDELTYARPWRKLMQWGVAHMPRYVVLTSSFLLVALLSRYVVKDEFPENKKMKSWTIPHHKVIRFPRDLRDPLMPGDRVLSLWYIPDTEEWSSMFYEATIVNTDEMDKVCSPPNACMLARWRYSPSHVIVLMRRRALYGYDSTGTMRSMKSTL
jgi:hypothetical protein